MTSLYGFDEDEFTLFLVSLKREIDQSGEERVEEEEARELFLMMQDEYNEMMGMDLEALGLKDLMGPEDVDLNETVSSGIQAPSPMMDGVPNMSFGSNDAKSLRMRHSHHRMICTQ
jgi:hypothetical protein